jgi:hypothetical protein
MTGDAAALTNPQGGSRGPDRTEPVPEPVGPAGDFAAFRELERERRRNSDDGISFSPAYPRERSVVMSCR